MTTLQELTQKIQKHCPELLELSFGCYVEFYGRLCVMKTTKAWGQFTTLYNCVQEDGESNWFNLDDTNITVLGHPITLEHVLKAIALRYGAHVLEWSGIQTCSLEAARAVAKWKFNKPLSEQSEDTIKWLNEIIV